MLRSTVLSLLLATSVPVLAEEARRFDIPSQELASALNQFAITADWQIVFAPELVKGLHAPRLEGSFTREEAIDRLLSGSGLRHRFLNDGTVLVISAAGAIETKPTADAAQPAQMRLAQADAGQSEAGAAREELRAEGAATGGEHLGEIIVTATRREQSIQNVPLSITAMSGADLERRGAKDFDGFVRTVPGLSMNAQRETQPTFVIRGIATQSASGNSQLPVATYVDDLPSLNSYAPVYTLDLRLFDVERVEVLRGPQGTLFGSGAVGGAIRVLTEKPDASTFAAKAEITGSTTREGSESYSLDAMVNLPLVEDRLALRIVGYDALRGGYVDNVLRGNDVNEARIRGGRVMLQWTPREDLSVLGTVLTQDKRVDDDAFVLRPDESLEWGGGAPNRSRGRFTDINLVVNWDAGPVTLTSSTNFAHERARPSTDLSPYFGPGATIDIDSPADFFTQEMRLASNGDGPFSYVAGAFYVDRDRQYRASLLDSDSGLLFAEDSDLPTSEAALFGEFSYKVLPKLQLTAGARAFRNRTSAQTRLDGSLVGGPTVGPRKSSVEEKVTPKFAATWFASDRATVYAVASEGYRTGHSNPVVPPDPLTGASRDSAYGPDSLWNYEVGVKSFLFDRRLRANLALFDIDWRDIQINQQYPDSFNYTANAGKAGSRGLELELDAQPTDRWSLGTALSYIDAKLDEDAPSIGGRKGNRLPGSSRFQISNAAQYEFPMQDGLDARIRFEHQYIGSAVSSIDSTVAAEYGDYHVLNLRFGLFRGPYEASLFVDNLADDRGAVFGSNSDDPFAYVVRLRPRTVGLTLRAAF